MCGASKAISIPRPQFNGHNVIPNGVACVVSSGDLRLVVQLLLFNYLSYILYDMDSVPVDVHPVVAIQVAVFSLDCHVPFLESHFARRTRLARGPHRVWIRRVLTEILPGVYLAGIATLFAAWHFQNKRVGKKVFVKKLS